MVHITRLKKQTAKSYARRMAAICKSGHVQTRHLDDCLEMGNGSQVIREFIKLHDADEMLRTACTTAAVRERVNVERWKAEIEQGIEP